MAIGDTHLPFEHKNYLKFCKDVYAKEQPDKVVHMGDYIDHYALSRFTLDPEKQGQKPEWNEAIEHAQKWYNAFPEVSWLLGNHDRRPYRKAKEIGLGDFWLKSMLEIYGAPKGWSIHDSLVIDDVLYFHGEAIGGQTGWQNYSQKISQSTVFGHLHSVGGVRYHQNVQGKQIFSMGVGSGVDDERYAFDYGKNQATKSMLSCGIIEDGVYAKVIPMDLSNRAYRRVR